MAVEPGMLEQHLFSPVTRSTARAAHVAGVLLVLLLAAPVAHAQLAEETAAEELVRADAWLSVIARQKEVGQRVMQWLAPSVLAGGALAMSGLLLSDEDNRKSTRWGFGLTAASTLALAVPTALSSHEQRPYWLMAGVSALFSGMGATFIANSHEPRDCLDDCLSPRGDRFVGAGILTYGIATLGFMLLPRGPSLAELQAAQRLPAEQRVRATQRLLLRMDRAQKSGTSLLVGTYLATGAVFGLGALGSEPGTDRDALTAVSAIVLSQAVINAVIGLLTVNRLERFVAGHGPRRGWQDGSW